MVREASISLLPNPNALVAVSEGMRAVQLCPDKLLRFLTGGAGITQVVLCNGHKAAVNVNVNVNSRFV